MHPAGDDEDLLTRPLALPCGAVLRNRLCKSAMTEGLGDARLRATERHVRLYRAWGDGGVALNITGNVMIDRWVIERPGNVAIDTTWAGSTDDEALARLRAWAEAGTTGGAHLWMQISHAGRQSPRYASPQPVGPSAVKLDLMGNYKTPRALEASEIADLVERFARAAVIAKQCGFTGVQIHAAHGYLISSFLSPVTNRRNDAWGGSLQNRARLLIDILRATRAAVGSGFPIGVKLNSDDFRKGGFSHEDCLGVVEMLNSESVDLLEISGGTYEQPRLLGISGRAGDAVAVRPSTRVREAYFLEYAGNIRKVRDGPLMVTGGFRSREGMQAALASGEVDMIGLARPLCTHPACPQDLLDRRIDNLPAYEQGLHLAAQGWRSPASPLLLMKMINVLGAQGWYYQQIDRLARGLPIAPERGMLRCFARYWWDDLSRAARLRRM